MNTLTLIKEAAKEARKWAERYQRKFKNEFPEDLCGMCALATAKLCHELETRGLKPVAVVEDNSVEGHCFAEVEGFAVDVTATQFGECKLYIKPMAKRHRFVSDSVMRKCHSLEELKQVLIRQQWPKTQRPCALVS